MAEGYGGFAGANGSWFRQLMVFWRPLHEEVHAVIPYRGKPQPFVQATGSIRFRHMQTEGFSLAGCFVQAVLQNGSTDPSLPVGREQGDIDAADFVVTVLEVQATNGALMPQDDLEIGSGELRPVGPLLGGELHPQKSLPLHIAPADVSQFVTAGAGVDFIQKVLILLKDGAERYRFATWGQAVFTHHAAGVG